MDHDFADRHLVLSADTDDSTERWLIAERGVTLDHNDVPHDALGVSRGGRISVRADLEPAIEFSVLAHELAHELLHRGEDRPASKTVRETEAEAVAFVICQAIGLETRAAASDYIQLFDGKAETLAASLDRIQRTAVDIIAALLGNGATFPDVLTHASGSIAKRAGPRAHIRETTPSVQLRPFRRRWIEVSVEHDQALTLGQFECSLPCSFVPQGNGVHYLDGFRR